jgi:predicted  nucleic acid-binding Zn-ribbon protein
MAISKRKMEENTLLAFLAEMKEGINNKLDAQAEDLREVKEQTKKTNGRVTELEKRMGTQELTCRAVQSEKKESVNLKRVNVRSMVGWLLALLIAILTIIFK